MEHSMRAMTRTIALAFVLLGLASAPLAAEANPPPPSNPPVAQPTGPQYQGPPPQAPQAQSPQPQGPQYSSNEIVDANEEATICFDGTSSWRLTHAKALFCDGHHMTNALPALGSKRRTIKSG